MRGSAPQAAEYKTNLNALPLIGSIRLLAVRGSRDSELTSRTLRPQHGVLLTLDLSVSRRDSLQPALLLQALADPPESGCWVRCENEYVGLARATVVTIYLSRVPQIFIQPVLQRDHLVVVGQRVASELQNQLVAHVTANDQAHA